MNTETIRLSQQGRDQLIKLKRWTGIKNWNTLCRWAFCLSLAEPSIPPAQRIPADSTVEMTWKTFGGKHADVYAALLRQRVRTDGFEPSDTIVHDQFRLHLHRGLGYLAGDKSIRSISDLLRMAVPGDAS